MALKDKGRQLLSLPWEIREALVADADLIGCQEDWESIGGASAA